MLKKELEDRQTVINNLQGEKASMQNRLTEVPSTNAILNDRLRVLQAKADQDNVAQEKERVLLSLNIDRIKNEKINKRRTTMRKYND